MDFIKLLHSWSCTVSYRPSNPVWVTNPWCYFYCYQHPPPPPPNPHSPSVLPLPLPVITWLIVIFCCRTFYGSHSCSSLAEPEPVWADPEPATPSCLHHWLRKKKAGLANRADYASGSGSGLTLRCCEQVLISVVGEDAIAASLLRGLSQMVLVICWPLPGQSSVKDIFTALISLSELHNINQRQSCRWRNFSAALQSSFYADQLPHDQLSKTFALIIIFATGQPQVHAKCAWYQIWSLICSLSWTIILFKTTYCIRGPNPGACFIFIYTILTVLK